LQETQIFLSFLTEEFVCNPVLKTILIKIWNSDAGYRHFILSLQQQIVPVDCNFNGSCRTSRTSVPGTNNRQVAVF